MLRRLNDRFLLVAAVSGRKPDEALKLIGHADIVSSGNHGFEVLRDGRVRMIPEVLPYLEKVQELENLTRVELAPQGAFLEENGITASIHYRNVPPGVGERCVELVKREGKRLGLEVKVGRGVVEARPAIRADQGTAVRALVEEYRPERAMFLGDDTMDLDAFRELEKLRDEGRLRDILSIGVSSVEGPLR